jgi:large subunit ribosomal protein L4
MRSAPSRGTNSRMRADVVGRVEALLDTLELAGRRVLLVLAAPDDVIGRSFRNLQDVHLLSVDQLNTYDVLCSDVVVFEQAALDYVGTGTRPGLPGKDEEVAS